MQILCLITTVIALIITKKCENEQHQYSHAQPSQRLWAALQRILEYNDIAPQNFPTNNFDEGNLHLTSKKDPRSN